MTSGLVKPGDMVDVLVVLRQSCTVRQTTARTILQKARVFAINEHFFRDDEAEGGVIQAKTVSLQVTPEQVEILTLAMKVGDLSLSIRAPGDDSEANPEGTSLEDLLRTSEVAEDTTGQSREIEDRSADGGLVDFVRRMAPPPMRVATNPEPEPTEPSFRTQIVDQNGSRWFEFGPRGDAPREVMPCEKNIAREGFSPAENAVERDGDSNPLAEQAPEDEQIAAEEASDDPDS
jgi:hypothetical protein